MGAAAAVEQSVILFDGVCNLCNSSVNFIIDRDRGYFRFASLQSEYAHDLLKNLDYDPATLESIVLLQGSTIKTKSSAALEIARHLKGGWKALTVFKLLPVSFRDLIYDFIARHRYKWFGKQDSCRIPTPELKERFLGSGDLM